MQPSKLVRDASRVHACLAELPDGRVVAKKPVDIYIPARFEQKGLAYVGVETLIVGIYAIVVEDQFYGISLVNAMIRIEPTSTLRVMFDGEEYLKFSFAAGSTVFADTQLVKIDTLTYLIYDEILAGAHVPWYLQYDDLSKIFDTAVYHAGANIGRNQEVTELIVSMMGRDPKDRTRYYRTVAKSVSAGGVGTKPVFIPMRNVQYGATNTTNKLAGSYFRDGLVSALNTPTDRVERIEGLLRK